MLRSYKLGLSNGRRIRLCDKRVGVEISRHDDMNIFQIFDMIVADRRIKTVKKKNVY